MALHAVARKEFRESLQSRTLVGLTAVFTLFAVGLAAVQWIPPIYRDSEVATSTLALLNSLRQSTVFLVPLTGLLLGYATIVGERESGTLKLALGLPNTRLELVLGKFLGKTAVMSVAILVSYAAAGLVALATYDAFAARAFLTYTPVALLLGAVYVAIATAFSAAMESRSIALGGALALYSVFLLFWNVVLLGLQVVTIGPELPPGTRLPDWIQFVGLLNPSTAFTFAVRAVIPEYYEITVFSESEAVFLQDWVGFVVLAAWVVVPLAVATARFRRLDR
jgi:ABC-2 type transport system permease protein